MGSDDESEIRVAFRWPARLVTRIDRFAERFEAEHKGLKLNRTRAVVMLLEKGLAAADEERKAKG